MDSELTVSEIMEKGQLISDLKHMTELYHEFTLRTYRLNDTDYRLRRDSGEFKLASKCEVNNRG